MNKLISILFVFSSLLIVNAQENNKRLLIKDAYLNNGQYLTDNYSLSVDDFRKIAPENLFNDTSFFNFQSATTTSSNVFNGPRFTPGFSVMIGIHLYDKNYKRYKGNPVFRIGFTQTKGSFRSVFYNQENIPLDTLVSPTTGVEVYVSQMYNESLTLIYDFTQLRLDMSLIYQLMEENRVNFFGGFGFNYGFSVVSKLDIHKHISTQYSPSSYSYTLENYTPYSQSISSVELTKQNQGGSVFIPVGVNFRLGEISEFWKKISFYTEIRPSVHFMKIPEISNSFRTDFYNIYQFGLKVNW